LHRKRIGATGERIGSRSEQNGSQSVCDSQGLTLSRFKYFVAAMESDSEALAAARRQRAQFAARLT